VVQPGGGLEDGRELARRGVYVSLQLDSLREEDTVVLRGGAGASKRRALANLEEAGVRTTLVCTVARGVNETRIGDGLNLLFERDFILSLMFQPAAYTGSGGTRFQPHDPLDVVTIPEVVRRAEEQSGGRLLRSDFLPLPCSHPSCFALTYLLKTADGYVPFPRFIETERYARMMANRGTIRPDEGFEDAIRGTIDELWTGSAQIPDSEKILQTLRKALTAMYPDGRALPIQERQRAGEALVKTIFIHAFMDEHTFDAERIRKCCTHYALPDGRLMPGCAFNMFHRHKDPRFAGRPEVG